MQNRVGKIVKAERLKKRLTRGQLALAMGFRNLSKGANRITRLERDGVGDSNFRERVALVLNLDPARLAQLSIKDHREKTEIWERQIEKPTFFRLTVRAIPGFYIEKRLPSNVETPEEAEAWACQFAECHYLKVCLQISNRKRVWIDKRGRVTARSEVAYELIDLPKTTVKGKTVRFF